MLLLSSADFFKINFFKKFFQEHYQSVKWFGTRSGPAHYSVGPDLEPNCLQRLSADDTGGQRVKSCCIIENMLERTHMGLDATKLVFGVSDKQRLKPVSSATETS